MTSRPYYSDHIQTWVHRHENDPSDAKKYLLAVDGDKTSDAAFHYVTAEVMISTFLSGNWRGDSDENKAAATDVIHVVHAAPAGDSNKKNESLKILSRYADKCAALKVCLWIHIKVCLGINYLLRLRRNWFCTCGSAAKYRPKKYKTIMIWIMKITNSSHKEIYSQNSDFIMILN